MFVYRLYINQVYLILYNGWHPVFQDVCHAIRFTDLFCRMSVVNNLVLSDLFVDASFSSISPRPTL